MNRWIPLMGLIGCGGNGSAILTPGTGPGPSQIVFPLETGSLYYDENTQTDYLSGARLEAPVRQFGSQVHRYVTDEDVLFFEQRDEDLYWWGRMQDGGRFQRPLLLVPADVRSGMSWEARDGSGGVTHIVSADRSVENPFGGGIHTAWNLRVEEVSGAYASATQSRSTNFRFIEGVGLVGVTQRGEWSANRVSGLGTPTMEAARVVRGLSVDPLDAPSLSLDSLDWSLPGRITTLAARTNPSGDTQIFVPFHAYEVEQTLEFGIAQWALRRGGAGACVTLSGSVLTEENGCPTTFGARPTGAFENGVLGPDLIDSTWTEFQPEWVTELAGGHHAQPTHGYPASSAVEDLVFRDSNLQWAAGAVDGGEPVWPLHYGFSKAGKLQTHDLTTHAEVLIADADGPVWRVSLGQTGPERELLGVVDLPDGHWLTGAIRVNAPTIEGSTLVVATTAGRLEPLGVNGIVADPSESFLWTTTLPEPTAVPTQPNLGVSQFDAGFVACNLHSNGTPTIDFDGIDGVTTTTTAFGGLDCALTRTGFDRTRGFPGTFTASLPDGVQIEQHRDDDLFGARTTLVGRSEVYRTFEGGGESHNYRFNDVALPIDIGPGPAQFDEPRPDRVADYVTGNVFETAVIAPDGLVRAAGGGGVYGVTPTAEGLDVRWTDGTSEWNRSLSGSFTDALVWADGRICTITAVNASCEGSDGQVRQAALEGALATDIGWFVTPTHGLRLTTSGAFSIDPETGRSERVASFAADGVSPPLQTDSGDVWMFLEGNASVRLDGQTADYFEPPPIVNAGNEQRPILWRPVVIDGFMYNGVWEFIPSEGEVTQVLGSYPLIESAAPPTPVVDDVPPGTRIGDVTVGDVISPGTDVAARGTTPDFVASSLVFTDPNIPVVYGLDTWLNLRPTGPVPLGFDGQEGTPGMWPGNIQLESQVAVVTSADSRFALMRNGTVEDHVVDLQASTSVSIPSNGLGSLDRNVSSVATDGSAIFLGDFGSGQVFDMVHVDSAGNHSNDTAIEAGGVQSVSLASGGRLLAATRGVDRVGIYVANTGDWVADLHSTADTTFRVAFGPVGRSLAVHSNLELELWTTTSGPGQAAFVRTGSTPSLLRDHLSWSPNGDRLIAMDAATLSVFDVTTGVPVLAQTFQISDELTNLGGVHQPSTQSLVWAADGSEFTLTGAAPGALLRFTSAP